jgi:hypothetical protein
MARMVEVRTELEAILVEQALAMARELELASDAAADGHVLAISEAVALRAGRELTRRALQATLQRQSDPAEQKAPPAGPAPAAGAASSRIRRPRRR